MGIGTGLMLAVAIAVVGCALISALFTLWLRRQSPETQARVEAHIHRLNAEEVNGTASVRGILFLFFLVPVLVVAAAFIALTSR